MMDDQTSRFGPEQAAAVDATVLAGLLAVGDGSIREALREQLLADFQRLSRALEQTSPAAISSAAHEVKGLAATIGAYRLADMARGLDIAAQTVQRGLLDSLAKAVRHEIGAVITHVSTSKQNARNE